VLLGSACLTASNTFAMLRLLPMDDRGKDVEILALRHQVAVLERQLGKQRVRFTSDGRAFLAALLHRLPSQVLRRLRCWCVRTRCCAGIVTSSRAGTPPSPGPSAWAGPGP
jgi:hypothetical protein